MKTYYHVTAAKNLPNIRRNGLIPRIGPRSIKLGENLGIFLFTSQGAALDAVANWLGDEFEEDEQLILLEVHLPARLRVSVSSGIDWEVSIKEPIPWSCIQVLEEVEL